MKISRVVALVLVVGLCACTSVKKELGVGRNSPDEFTVVKRAPLSMPPDYALRAPDGAGTPPAARTAAQAKNALMGTAPAEPQKEKGSAESALLQKLGTSGADPDIRAEINRENGFIALENQSVTDKLIFWEESRPLDETAPASVVDAQAETERLKKNKNEGKPVNEGEVPTIEKKTGTIDKIF